MNIFFGGTGYLTSNKPFSFIVDPDLDLNPCIYWRDFTTVVQGQNCKNFARPLARVCGFRVLLFYCSTEFEQRLSYQRCRLCRP